jgi:hypothetical protein
MANLDWPAAVFDTDQYRHQFVIPCNQRLIRVDIDNVNRKRITSLPRLQRMQHVVTQMAVGAGIEQKVNHNELVKID